MRTVRIEVNGSAATLTDVATGDAIERVQRVEFADLLSNSESWAATLHFLPVATSNEGKTEEVLLLTIVPEIDETNGD